MQHACPGICRFHKHMPLAAVQWSRFCHLILYETSSKYSKSCVQNVFRIGHFRVVNFAFTVSSCTILREGEGVRLVVVKQWKEFV